MKLYAMKDGILFCQDANGTIGPSHKEAKKADRISDRGSARIMSIIVPALFCALAAVLASIFL